MEVEYRSASDAGRQPDVTIITKQMAIVAWQPGPNRIVQVPTEVSSNGVVALRLQACNTQQARLSHAQRCSMHRLHHSQLCPTPTPIFQPPNPRITLLPTSCQRTPSSVRSSIRCIFPTSSRTQAELQGLKPGAFVERVPIKPTARPIYEGEPAPRRPDPFEGTWEVLYVNKDSSVLLDRHDVWGWPSSGGGSQRPPSNPMRGFNFGS